MDPYLVMVLAGYAAFVGVLGFVWLRQYVSELRQPAEARPAAEQDRLRKAA